MSKYVFPTVFQWFSYYWPRPWPIVLCCAVELLHFLGIGSAFGANVSVSDGSRLGELARPALRAFAPSRAELEKQYIERQQQRMADERKHNEKTMYNAIHHPQTKKTVKARELTVPKEFKLSSAQPLR